MKGIFKKSFSTVHFERLDSETIEKRFGDKILLTRGEDQYYRVSLIKALRYIKLHVIIMHNHWIKPRIQGDGIIQSHTCGDTLTSGRGIGSNSDHKNSGAIRTNTLADIEPFIHLLPNDIRTYTYECLKEHSQAICDILTLGYECEELFFRDYLSGPRNEIASHELDILKEAFKDVRYELVPTIRFANRNIENKEDDISETSSLFIEFHKRGMAF